ncbi:hypothetical protein E4U21_003295 [Claviceps maximensis]|nr:hypothetical protein E4U21_003295 [Claviceps maximensis]
MARWLHAAVQCTVSSAKRRRGRVHAMSLRFAVAPRASRFASHGNPSLGGPVKAADISVKHAAHARSELSTELQRRSASAPELRATGAPAPRMHGGGAVHRTAHAHDCSVAPTGQQQLIAVLTSFYQC